MLRLLRSAKGEWTRKKLDVPDNQAVDIVSANGADDRFFLEMQGFLTTRPRFCLATRRRKR